MGQIDYTSKAGQLQLQESINSELRILAGRREKYLAGCYNVLETTKAKQSKNLAIGTLDMSRVEGELDDISSGEITVGAAYLNKEEYAEEVIFPGSMLRHAERDPVPKATERMMEADDFLMDKTLMDALYGPMFVGDTFQPKPAAVPFIIQHGGTGITPEKITSAGTMIKRFMPRANLVIGFDADIQEQLTKFDQFTNSDFLLNGQSSANNGKSEGTNWYDIMFKHVPDFVKEDASDRSVLPELKPVMPIEKYIVGGVWDGESYVRHVPVWGSSSVDFEESMAPNVEVFPVHQQRRKPKGTLAARIDHELGFARNNPYGVAIIQVVITNPYLKL